MSDPHARYRRVLEFALLQGLLASASVAADQPEPPVITIDTSGLPPRSLPPALPDRPLPGWLRNHWRVGHLPPGLGRMPEAFLKAGYEVITINALRKWDIVGPTAHLYKPDEVSKADDYLRRFVALVHGAGAKAVLYIGPVQVPMFSPEFVKAHPDWLRINPDGKPDQKPNFANIRSGYADWLLGQLRYVVRTYHVDGFWLDGYAPDHLHTFDAETRAAFRTASGGKDIPAGRFNVTSDPVARQYLAWHEGYFLDLADRMRAAIRAENPEAVLFVNHSGCRTSYAPEAYMGEYPLCYSRAVDVSSVELYWDVPGDALYQQFVYAFMEAITRRRASSVWIQPQEHGIAGVSSPVEIQLRGLEGLPWGVIPEFVESAGREDYLRRHGENIKAREPWLADSEPVPYIGIVASEQTRTLYGRGALPMYLSHVLGAFRALLETHVPIRLLTEADLEDGELQGVRVLVLPNTACLSDRGAEVIRRFVRAGGGLVASGETSLFDGVTYSRRNDFALADVLHARYVSLHPVTQQTEALTLSLEAEHAILDDPVILSKQNTAWRNPEGAPPRRGPLSLIASAVEVVPASDAQVLATYTSEDPRLSGRRLPAVMVAGFGQGRAVYFPAGVDKAMFFYPDGYQRRLIAGACRWAAHGASPPLEVEGPLILAATFRRQPASKRAIVHLLNHASSWGMHSIYQKLAPLPAELQRQYGHPDRSELRGTWPSREEVIPLHDIHVTCRIPGVTRAKQQPENLELPLKPTAGGVEVIVPKLGMHAMVVFE
jgi:hypothetical protein